MEKSKVEALICDREFSYLQPYFYNNPYALRCELGVGEGVQYHKNAKERALKIYNILFPHGADAIFFDYYVCDYSTSGGWICFNCGGNGDCGCHGCSVTGCAMLEDASFDIPSIWCGCWYEDPDPDPNSATNTPSSPPGGPSITLSLDENIVLFEAAYTNAPGESVDRHSTEVELTVEYDNPTEHSLTVILSVQSGQSCIRMRDASLGAHVSGWSYTCPSKTSGSNSFSIEGLKRSSGQGDVRLHGTIGFANDTACLTVVEVALTPERTTGDDLVHRHQFGVCERVWCESYPSGMGVTWQCNGNGSLVPSGAHYRHQVPFDAHNYVLTAEIGSLTLLDE